MKRHFIFLIILLFTLPAMSQIRVDLNRKINREANRRANRQADNAVDKSFSKVEDGIGGMFKKKKGNSDADQEKDSKGTNESNSGAAFGAFTSLSPAEGDITTLPIQCSWEIPDMETYKFTVHLEGDDWMDWLTKTTGKNQCTFSGLPTATKNLKWQVIAVGNGERLESPWQNFTLSDETNGASKPAKPEVQWAKFDFVPGDEVIFEDGPSADEENGEFPSRWDAAEGKAFYAKNFRIAKGGVKYYDRVLSDGKIIVNGIRFDVNKATIKPESNGAINEIFELMQKQPTLNFSVEGHTDSDGDEALNQSLSESRARAVMERLIDMGIPANRLKSAGWGESKPIGENTTAEGKANNRRVEFVKF